VKTGREFTRNRAKRDNEEGSAEGGKRRGGGESLEKGGKFCG